MHVEIGLNATHYAWSTYSHHFACSSTYPQSHLCKHLSHTDNTTNTTTSCYQSTTMFIIFLFKLFATYISYKWSRACSCAAILPLSCARNDAWTLLNVDIYHTEYLQFLALCFLYRCHYYYYMYCYVYFCVYHDHYRSSTDSTFRIVCGRWWH